MLNYEVIHVNIIGKILACFNVILLEINYY